MKHTGKSDKVVILNDLHIPYHDKKAVKLAVAFVSYYKPDVIVLNGDVMDCKTVAKYEYAPNEAMNLQSEIEQTKLFLKELKEAHVKCLRYYLFGNHELRVQKFLIRKAKELYGLVCLEEKFDIQDDYIVVNENMVENYLQIGNWYIGHFEKCSKHGGYTAKNIIDDRGVNIVQAHVHRLALIMKSFIDRTVTGVESGCLCKNDPGYIIMPNWQLGFVVLQNGVPHLVEIYKRNRKYCLDFGNLHAEA